MEATSETTSETLSEMTSAPLAESSSIRLRVGYKTPAALLWEYTRSVSQGEVVLEVGRGVPVGTRFLFELVVPGLAPVAVEGQVVEVAPLRAGRFRVRVRYTAGDNREPLDAVLHQVMAEHENEPARRHPRLPLRLRAQEEAPAAPAFWVRDISRSGMGVELEAEALPPSVRVGVAFQLELRLDRELLRLPGDVVWTSGRAQQGRPSFGVRFDELGPGESQRLERLLALQSLPTGPWRARVSFGEGAPEAGL